MGERALARRRAIVEEIERDGHDSTLAKALLLDFEKHHVIHRAERDRLQVKLSNLNRDL